MDEMSPSARFNLSLWPVALVAESEKSGQRSRSRRRLGALISVAIGDHDAPGLYVLIA